MSRPSGRSAKHQHLPLSRHAPARSAQRTPSNASSPPKPLARVPTRSSKRRLVQHLWRAEGQPEGHLRDALTYHTKTSPFAQLKSAYRGLADPQRERISDNKAPLVATLLLSPATEGEILTKISELLPLLKSRLQRILEDGAALEVERLVQSCLGPDDELALHPLLPRAQNKAKLSELVNTLWEGSEEALRQLATGSEGVKARVRALQLLARLKKTAKQSESMKHALEALQSPWPRVQAAALKLLFNAEAHADTERP